MNEADTRAELIDPKLKASGWGIVADSKILREYPITAGRIRTGGARGRPLTADYVLMYQGINLAVIEAKSDENLVGEGVAQAKNYAEKLKLDIAFASNGNEIYQIDMKSGKEGPVADFPDPDQLRNKIFRVKNRWEDKFSQIPFENLGGTKHVYYYQEIAVNRTMAAIAHEKKRILLTLATGTGKTFIAFQIAWKLFHTRWNLKQDGSRRPRILFLADRNILANQAFNAFSAFPEDALLRINPKEISKKGGVPVNGSIFFTIFQTFMTGKENKACFGEYPSDFFDFIVIDECHRGGADDESSWRGILEYFSPAVQLGLTATPKRKDNVDTYKYFGEPVYIYSLREGVNDGFLTPFKVKRIKTTLDEYIYTSDDLIIEGEIEEGRIYKESDFNKIIEIKEREAKRVQIFLSEINPNEKSLVFCASQDHALAVRDLVNQYKQSREANYCARVTANDGALGEQYLREFQDNEKTVPTILTTSHKLSTGVDARNIRNIVLMRPINSMIEFKQIIGRGTRVFDGKAYFTIYDFVDAYHHFSDPEWDGEPIDETSEKPLAVKEEPAPYGENEAVRKTMVKIMLGDGKMREIRHIIAASFWSAEGKAISAQEFLQNLFGVLPEFFKSEEELRKIWSYPMTRKILLDKLADAGYDKADLIILQTLINAEKSDLFDVLEYVSFAVKPLTRKMRAAEAQSKISAMLNRRQKEFLEFVLSKYIESGVEELNQEKLPDLLKLKYQSVSDAADLLGDIDHIRSLFADFQKYLYEKAAA